MAARDPYTPRKWRVYLEEDGHTVAELQASSEIGALLGISYGYSGPRFERDYGGRPAMVTATDVYRAEEIP